MPTLAKLSTGEIVKVIRSNQTVRFAPGRWWCISKGINNVMHQTIPYWVPGTLIVWCLDFEEKK